MSDFRVYYWVGNISGYLPVMYTKDKPTVKTGERLKYLGYTQDCGWPKKLNTGRVIYKPSSKAYKKQKKKLRNILRRCSKN